MADSFEDLEVWQVSMDLAVRVPDHVLGLPREFRWLALQIMDSSESVPSNIAEGFERRLNGDFMRFLRIAKASLGETDSHLVYARRRRLLTDEAYESLREDSLRIRKMLSRFIAYLSKYESPGKSPKPRTKNAEP